MKKLLMATDLTARSDRALQRALALARDFGCELKIIHVLDETILESVTLQKEAAAREVMGRQLHSLPLAQDLAISTEVVRGHDFADILRSATEFDADLIVLGIHRHTTREMFRGTTAERVVRHGRQPVLVVKDTVVASYRRALVPVDLSPHAEAAIALASRLVPKGEVNLLHVAHRPYTAFLGRETQGQLIQGERARVTAELESRVKRQCEALGENAPRFTTLLREGDVRRVIREQISSLAPDLVVVGTHGRPVLAEAIIGSVAEDLLADAPVDVLAVKAL
jgi:universal stress protein E